MQYRSGPALNSPTRIKIQNFEFLVEPNTSSFVNGPFTAPIEVPENIHAVGDHSLFDIIPAASETTHSVQLSGADADLFTATSTLVDNAGAPRIIRVILAFSNAPNYEFPQGGPGNNSNDYQVHLTVSGVGTNITVRVTDETEPPGRTLLRLIRLTPTGIAVSWEVFVNTGPPILESRVIFNIPSINFLEHSTVSDPVRGIFIDVNEKTYSRIALTPNTEYVITVRVETDEGVSTSNVVRVTTPNPSAPDFAADVTIPDQLYLTERLILPLTLPEATGGNGTLTYTLTGSNGETVPGLSFDPDTRVLSGTPHRNAAAPAMTYTYTYTAMDADDNTGADDVATLGFRITVEADSKPRFARSTPGLAFLKDKFIKRNLPEAVDGNGALTYELLLAAQLPKGLTFNDITRPPTIGGTPTDLFEKQQFVYAVTDADENTAVNDSDMLSFNIAVVDSFPKFFETVADQRLSANTGFSLMLPDAGSGTTPRTFTLTGPNGEAVSEAVPGLAFDPSSRALSGTPNTPAITALTYTVTDANEATDTISFSIIVAPAVALDAPGNQTYTMDIEIAALTLPLASGGTIPLTYTLQDGTGNDVDGTDNAVPGLTFDTTARTLTGTPTEAGTTELTYTATDQNGSTASETFTVTVAAAVALADTGDQTYTMGTEIPALTLPVATGGTIPLTYTLTGPNGTDLSELPAGLMWTGATTNPGTITGEPTAVTTSPVTLTYIVTDQNGSTAMDTFTVTVAAAVALADTGNQTYTMGTEIPALTLPVATGGTIPLTYTLTGPNGTDLSELPAGLMWTGDATNPGTITGTPTAITTNPIILTYTVTDQNGSTAMDTFTVTVAAAVVLTPRTIRPIRWIRRSLP